jgi:T-complex protein 1 subunit theta
MRTLNYDNSGSLFEEGSRLFGGFEEVILKNIEICNFLKELIKSSYGPDGMNKLICISSGKSIITNLALDILKNLNLFHPVSKVVLYFALSQEINLGDSTGFIIIFTSELLKKAFDLLKEGYHISEITDGFLEAGNLTLKLMETLTKVKLTDFYNVKIISSLISLILGRSIQGLENFLAPQIAYACTRTLSTSMKKISTNDIRVIKVLGGSFDQIKTINGTIILKDTEGKIKKKKKANLLIFLGIFDISSPETKNSILFESAEEIMTYEMHKNRTIEDIVKEIHNLGVNVIVASGFTDLSIFFLEKYNIMILKVQSKFDLRRIALTTNGIVLNKLKKPTLEEIGKCDFISVRSFGSQKITFFQQDNSSCKIFTIIARASSTRILDFIEKLVYRSACVFKTIIKDNRFLPGAGAWEIEMCRRLKSYSFNQFSGFKQLIMEKFADAFESLPKTLLENSGFNDFKILSSLHISHSFGNETEGIDLQNFSTINSKEKGIWDSFPCKFWAIRNSMDAALTILTIDQILMAKNISKG